MKLKTGVESPLQWSAETPHLYQLLLTHRDDEFSQMDFSNALQSLPKTLTAEKTQTSTDSRQIGTATHLIIEKLDLTSPVTLETVRALAADLSARRSQSE